MSSSKVKKGLFYGAVGLTAVLLVVLFGPGLAFPVLGFLPDETLFSLMNDVDAAALSHRLHELTAGIFSWAVLLGVLVQFRKPERKVAPLLAALAVPVVWGIVEAINGNLVISDTALLLIPLLAVALLHPRARDFLRVGRIDKRLAGLTALAAVPWAMFAVSQAQLQQGDVTGDAHAEAGHWGLMAGFALLVLVWGMIGASDRPGWRITGFMAAVASVLYGLQSLLFPEVASAAPVGLALAATAWGVIYGAVAWRRGRVDEPAAESELLPAP